MTLTSAEQVRLRIQDQAVIFDETRVGDGSGSAFNLLHRNVVSGSALVPGSNGQWSATGATFDPTGVVVFSSVISANSAYRVRYVWSTFSDDEIDQMLGDGGSVVGASIEAVQTLMFDGLKRSRWSSPDGTEHDDTKALDLLRDLYATLKKEQSEAAIGGGEVWSWSLNQEDY